MPKTVAGAIEISYYLEPLMAEEWLSYISLSGGTFSLDSNLVVDGDVTAHSLKTATAENGSYFEIDKIGIKYVSSNAAMPFFVGPFGSRTRYDMPYAGNASFTVATVEYIDAEIGKVKDGTYTSGKAERDANGDVIHDTYGKLNKSVIPGVFQTWTGYNKFQSTMFAEDGIETKYVTLGSNGTIHARQLSDFRIAVGYGSNTQNTYVLPYAYDSNLGPTTYTLSTTSYVEAIRDAFLTGTLTAKKAEQDSIGRVIKDTYGNLITSNNWNSLNVFNMPTEFKGDVVLSSGAAAFRTPNRSSPFVVTSYLENPNVDYYLPYDASNTGNTRSYVISTSADVAAAEQRAKSFASSAVNDAMTDLHTNDQSFAGNVTVGGNLTVNGEMTSVDSTTISTSERFVQLMKGNAVAVSGYTGFAWPTSAYRYETIEGQQKLVKDGFFMGLQGDTEVLGEAKLVLDNETNQAVIGIIPNEVYDEDQHVISSSLIPLAGRALDVAIPDGFLLKWDASTRKLISAGVSATAMAQAEDTRVSNENIRIANENSRAAEDTLRARVMPYPITMAEYGHLKNDGYYYNIYLDNGQVAYSVTQSAMQGALHSFLYQPDAVYQITDDAEIQQMLSDCAEASDYVANQVFVTPEQYAELARQGLIDPDKNYYVQDDGLYEELTVTIPAQEEARVAAEAERQAFETYRIEHEGYGITRAQLAMLSANGVFGVHFATVNDKLTTVVSVYASQALAEASEPDGAHIFPMQQGVTYALLD